MSIKLYTTGDLDQFRLAPKRILNPGARWSAKPQIRPVHRQRKFKVAGEGGQTVKFQIYQRQNLSDEQDFSCGILYLPHHGEPLTLVRYNGPSHEHGAFPTARTFTAPRRGLFWQAGSPSPTRRQRIGFNFWKARLPVWWKTLTSVD